MAKLSSHGAEVGRIEFATSAKAYMADGKILKNIGFGWKLYGKCKVEPAAAYTAAVEKQRQFLTARPLGHTPRLRHQARAQALRGLDSR